MKPKFWHNRWKNQQIGFHQADFNSHLVNYWKYLELPKNSTVFVPLCGKSLDLLWLSDQEFNVIGCELVQSAVEGFFTENHLEYQVISDDNAINLYQTSDGKIKIYQGDFFKLTSKELGNIDAIYDRASLIAFPPEMRITYTDHLKQHISDFKMLLITLEYNDGELQGPPFSVKTEEVKSLYKNYNNQLLDQKVPNEKSFSFQATFNIQTKEKIYLIQNHFI